LAIIFTVGIGKLIIGEQAVAQAKTAGTPPAASSLDSIPQRFLLCFVDSSLQTQGQMILIKVPIAPAVYLDA
jgi:hypothetical protein